MDEYSAGAETTRLLRLQRHDFLNHIQVIHALIQLGKNEKALQYIDDVIKSPEMTGDIQIIYQSQHKSAD